MNDIIPIITAVIAFTGTVIGIVVGYRKWKKEKNAERYGQYEKEKQEAYKELWNQVEDFNIKVRIEEVDDSQFSQYLQNLNSFLLKGGLYIGETEKNLANNYVKAVLQFQKAVKNANNEAANVALGETSAIPPEVLKNVREIGDAQTLALKLREQLLGKIKTVLSGT